MLGKFIGSEMHTATQTRALESAGSSSDAVYQMVSRALLERHRGGGTLVDVGCGSGSLWHYIHQQCDRYLGVYINQYEGFPSSAEFIAYNLDKEKIPLDDATADIVVSVETIEHLENPRAFVRELVRLAKPGGLVMVTTPNQQSLLSKLTFLLKNQFNAFQEAPGLYPAHITALLEIDLRRIFAESRLNTSSIDYNNDGRIPFLSWKWPQRSGFRGGIFSDNLICSGIKY